MSERKLLARYRKLGIALLAALLGASCGGGNAGQTQGGPAPADLALNTASIDVGNVAVGGSNSKSVMLSNASPQGGGNITVSEVTVSGTGFSASPPPLPLTLAPGQNSNITITFAPKSAGSFQGTLSVQVQGVSQPATVALAGTGLAAGQLGISPAAMDFGSVTVGSNQQQVGSLTAGAADITVSSASWNGDGFSLSGISFPVVVPAGQSMPFTVTFAPQVAGSASGGVSFVSDASNSPTNQSWAGTGAQGSAHSVSLTWNASVSNVVGYNLYRGTQPGGPYKNKLNGSPLPGTSFTDSSVQSGTTYYYVATAVDANSQESVYSNEASAVIP